MSQIEQVRKVLESEYPTPHPKQHASVAAEIHALYASERGGDVEREFVAFANNPVHIDLAEALDGFQDDVVGPRALAAAILRAIDARVGAKGENDLNGANLEWVNHHSFWTDVNEHVYKVLDDVSPGWKTRSQTDWMVLVEDAIRALAEAKATAEREYHVALNVVTNQALALKEAQLQAKCVNITEAQAIAALEACGWKRDIGLRVDTDTPSTTSKINYMWKAAP